ncbi:hypothetical protein JCM19294_1442 [Nonlabens tegetincola]|uniref:Uncharacterized protein n=1 Tax=Nonlabens tegetincola TaxID=323273 RepID=A0A090QPH7_9FLAO|nr:MULTISPECIES: DUF4197 domain-containing protein [Nonlabens]ALM20386.1 hypothetical protein AAT17_03635 [Nonlabens sp. MIC269]ARN70551.1 hypothetical protein BST91_02190 [Nonlabens tegetincola]MEE2801060.1 DUF4197 domain-containing protein [Bacteroidota bacterium]GAK97396.1 hypothetical protein JCM19294_1442 [Nonlabens tegetincola]
MKRFSLIFALLLVISSCKTLQDIANNLPQGGALSQAEIGNGLRAALDQGIDKEVTKLMQKDGFYRNEAVKILLPDELQKVDKGLRKIGLSSIADEGLKLLNRAAEDATKEALPIFTNAVKEITFNDAKNILLGDDRAATSYLEAKTTEELRAKFSPVIQNNLGKVGATDLWSNAITKYNSLPLTDDVNPDLTQYVTEKALEGVFKMIAQEELQIRNKVSSRSTDLLKRVFALQD